MPIYRIDIIWASTERYLEYRSVEGITLEAYYTRVLLWTQRRAQVNRVPIRSFEVVQISETSREAREMRQHNRVKMFKNYSASRTIRRPIVRNRRF